MAVNGNGVKSISNKIILSIGITQTIKYYGGDETMEIKVKIGQSLTQVLENEGLEVKEIFCVTESGCVDDFYFTEMEEAEKCSKTLKEPLTSKLVYNEVTEEFEPIEF